MLNCSIKRGRCRQTNAYISPQTASPLIQMNGRGRMRGRTRPPGSALSLLGNNPPTELVSHCCRKKPHVGGGPNFCSCMNCILQTFLIFPDITVHRSTGPLQKSFPSNDMKYYAKVLGRSENNAVNNECFQKYARFFFFFQNAK